MIHPNCNVCKRSGKTVPAIYWMQLHSGKDWCLCERHATIVNKSLLTIRTPLVRITKDIAIELHLRKEH